MDGGAELRARPAGPHQPAPLLYITFNTLTVTVYNVSILQNHSVNSGIPEQGVWKINNQPHAGSKFIFHTERGEAARQTRPSAPQLHSPPPDLRTSAHQSSHPRHLAIGNAASLGLRIATLPPDGTRRNPWTTRRGTYFQVYTYHLQIHVLDTMKFSTCTLCNI